jgi:hypothetical protein
MSEAPIETNTAEVIQTNSENNNFIGVPTRKKFQHLQKQGKRTHTVSEPFEVKRQRYLEIKEMRQKLKEIRAEKLEEV